METHTNPGFQASVGVDPNMQMNISLTVIVVRDHSS